MDLKRTVLVKMMQSIYNTFYLEEELRCLLCSDAV